MKKTYIAKPNKRKQRQVHKRNESKLNTILTNGRDMVTSKRHSDDENGPSEWGLNEAEIFDKETGALVENCELFLDNFTVRKFDKQSKVNFLDGKNVVAGQSHVSDENGATEIITATPILRLKDNEGRVTKEIAGKIINVTQVGPFRESDGTSAQSEGQFLVGYHHARDENGPSILFFGTIIFEC